jgi:hypothetical protein
MKLLSQRLKEVDAELLRIGQMYCSGNGAKMQTKELEKLKGYRRQVVNEMEAIERM